MIRCACDACVEVAARAAGWSSDGLCAFCDQRCFPLIHIGGVAQRGNMSRESRLLLHQREAARTRPPSVPPSDLVGAALRLIPDRKTRKRAELAMQVANAVGPVVVPGARALLGRLIRRK